MDADVHAVRNLGVVFLGGASAGLDSSLIGRDELAVGVHGDAVGGNLVVGDTGEAMCNSLLGLVKSLDLAPFAADLLQVVEVALADGCDILAAEDADFEVVRLFLTIFASDLGT